jgi:hypothetical protein
MSSHACKYTFLEVEDFNYMNISSWMLSLSKLISLAIGLKNSKFTFLYVSKMHLVFVTQ